MERHSLTEAADGLVCPRPVRDSDPTRTLTTTDILRRERRSFPGPKAGVSTPHNR
jgi:hypothetical protein